MARILIIDDDVHLLKMLGLILERAGHETVLASHGQEGIELATSNPPDLVIIDVMMPEMSGHEVCKNLRANPITVDLPILILTARSQPVDREVALSFGADDFMAKPVAPKDLAQKVSELLDRPAKKQRGRVVTIFSLRGGVGVTTIAANLAGALRSQQVPNITLIDLSPNSGHIALQLRIQPQRTWGQLLQFWQLEPETIRSLLINHPSGLHVLAAPISPTLNASLTETQIAAIANILCDRAEFVIIDAPPILNPMCIGALRASDLIMLVLTPDVASIQTITGTLHMLVELGISGKRVHLLLNNPSSQQGLPKQAVERALKRPMSFEVTFDAAQSRALAQGKPLSLDNTRSPLPDSMRMIAAALKRAA